MKLFCYIITVLLSGGQGVSTSVPGQFQPFACPTLDTVPTEALPTLGGGTGGDTVLVTGPPLAASTYKFRIMRIKKFLIFTTEFLEFLKMLLLGF